MRAANYYAAPGFERAGLRRRDMAWVAARIDDPATVFVPVWRNQSLVIEVDGAEPRAGLMFGGGLGGLALPTEGAEALLAHGAAVFLGVIDERAHFAIDLSHHEAAPIEALHSPILQAAGLDGANLRFADLRQLAGRLDRHEGALLAFARAMCTWHSRHRFCGLCGSPTRSEEAGFMRRCTDPACSAMHFPRTDPAVIMLVTDGERALMGRNKNFIPGMYSTLAGFVEPGEALEDAVAREVREETGIRVGAVDYHSSQLWPFPANDRCSVTTPRQTTWIIVDYASRVSPEGRTLVRAQQWIK